MKTTTNPAKPPTSLPLRVAALPPAPATLGPEAAEKWAEIVADYDFEKPLLLVLQLVLEHWEKSRLFEAAIKAEMAKDGWEERLHVHRLNATKLNTDSLIGRQIKQLGVDLEPVLTVGRPTGK